MLQENVGRWLWLKILVSGFFLFFLLEYALKTTGNINYVPSLLAIGTFTLPLSFLVLLYTRDKIPQVSLGNLLTCVVWGGILGTVLAGRLEYETLRHLGTVPTFMIGLIEEAAKLAVPAWLISRRGNRGELDAIVIGAASGAGFAAFESMGYGLVALLASGGSPTAITEVLLLRGLMAPAAHIAWTAVTASALWRVTHAVPKHPLRRFVYTFLGVALLHALWDSITPLGMAMYIALGLISLSWLFLRLHKAANTAGPLTMAKNR
jgi:RsiW-degrading membrane proteinase PrsW (M82 family)